MDAVVASNDGTAGGAVAALTAQGMEGIPVSGQDGDHAALNRIALGTQTVSVWKDARDLGRTAAEIAVALAGGTAMSDVEGAVKWTSPTGTNWTRCSWSPRPGHAGQPEPRGGRRLDPAGNALPGRRERPSPPATEMTTGPGWRRGPVSDPRPFRARPGRGPITDLRPVSLAAENPMTETTSHAQAAPKRSGVVADA